MDKWLLFLLFLPIIVSAHHGPTAFDRNTLVAIEGTVKEFKWGNPHVYMAVETTDSTGKRYVQQIEAGPASQLLPRGVTRDLLHAGDRVTVRANPNTGGPGRTVLGLELTTANGARFPLQARELRALGAGEVAATSIAGSWVPQPEGFMGLAAAIRTWPTTALAKKVVAGDRSDMRAYQIKCIPQGTPSLMANSTPITVVINDKAVTFDIDWGVQAHRVVHIGANHPADIKPTLLGHSVGHWDGKTLIVDTVGFEPHPEGMGFEFPSSKAKHTIERFSLSDDHKHLNYKITIEDSNYLTAAVMYQTQWDYRPGQKQSNAPCDPTTARRFLDEK